MKRYPAGAGCDDDPRWRWDRRRGDVPAGAVVVPFSCRRLNSPFGSLRRPENALDAPKRPLRLLCRCVTVRATELTVPSHELTVRATECTDSSHSPAGLSRTVELGTEAAEILISPSGGVPAARGEAAATSERSERERVAVRSRSRLSVGDCEPQLASGVSRSTVERGRSA
jgi:hypothetical protein